MNAQLISRIRQCRNLPTLPAVAVQVLELAQQAEADLPEIARVISRDPALSSRILRTVNSSFYGRSQNVGTISHALVLLGLAAVKTLVLGFSLVSNLSSRKPQGFKHVVYWKRSIYAATAARSLGKRLNLPDVEEAFLAALLQDIGMLVLDAVLGDEYGTVYDKAPSHADLTAEEQRALGTNHAEVGGVLAADWKLPAVLVTPIANHHSPQAVSDARMKKLTEAVALSGLCADVFVEEMAAQPIAEVRQFCASGHGIGQAECDAMLDEIGRNTREVASLFEINIGKQESYEDILKRAKAALLTVTPRRQRQPGEAPEGAPPNEAAQAPDAQAILADRARLGEFLARQLASASGPLSLLVLDVDGIKQVAEVFGAPAAGQVVQSVAELVRSAARPLDVAAQCGDDEFALALPGTARATAVAIAETIRRAISARPLALGKNRIQASASIGVACFEPGGPLSDAPRLLKAAQLALAAAKRSGRNCVRIFSLKTPAAAA